MSVFESIKKLKSMGLNITFYKRKDGGYLIKSINGVKYTGAKGNIAARELTGDKISEARKQQLSYATRTRKKLRARRAAGKMTIDEQIESAYAKVKKKWNKAFKSKKGKPHPAGYFGWERIQYSIEKYGKEEALRRISEAERYASGLAYNKNVEILIVFIEDAASKFNSRELKEVATALREQAYRIKDEWIQPAYDELYKLNVGVSPKDVAKNLRKILRLDV